MRCIHCGKEISDGVVFCIHCDRPAKREYAHYACEFYDSVSISERIANIFSRISVLGHDDCQKHFGKSKYRKNTVNFKTKANEKWSSVKSSFANYIQSISSLDQKENESIKLDDVVDTGKKLIKFLSQ